MSNRRRPKNPRETFLDDQGRAAVHDATRYRESLVGDPIFPFSHGLIEGPPKGPWATLVEQILQASGSADAEPCRHVTDVSVAPMAVYVYAALPTRPMCKTCFAEVGVALFVQHYGTEWDNTCDACGHVSEDGITPMIEQHNNLIITAGLCDQCCIDTGARPGRSKAAAT